MITEPSYSLLPIKGVLDYNSLLHLLRRAFFGVGQTDIDTFSGKDIQVCMSLLLTPSKNTDLVQQDSDVTDPLVPFGKPWFNAPYETDLIDNRRGLQLKMWWVGQILNRDYSLTEKMRLFWHSHFVTEMDVVKDSRYSYRYVTMLRRHALGNYKKLLEEGTTNIAMLVYLNGNTNTKAAPNENYARELMELFTLGKGNGSEYTEEDIREAARVLTGWKDNKVSIAAEFEPELHDTGEKKFSSYFDNRIIKGKSGTSGQEEFKELIEMIISRKETAKFVCRNLYRWFVSGEINTETELKIIAPLAETFVASGYEIRPVLKQLLSSEHFFDKAFRGCIVKSPVDFLLGCMRQFDVVSSCSLDTNFENYLQFYFYLGDLSMDIGNPPSVAGWPAYYQMPKYHQWWVNSATLGLKSRIIAGLASSEGLGFNSKQVRFNFVYFASKFANANNADAFHSYCINLLFAVSPSGSVNNSIKKILSDVEPASSWENAWNEIRNNSASTSVREKMEVTLRKYFKALINLPEFQMM